jgi:hypothetical protein
MSLLPVEPAYRLAERSDEHRWLVTGLWSEQAVGIVGGEPKCCKSFLALDLAVAVAAGVPCLRRIEIADIMKAAGLESPDISILSDEFLAEVPRDHEKEPTSFIVQWPRELGDVLRRESEYPSAAARPGAACLPSPQPWVSDACGVFGLGGRPRRAERIAWKQRPAGDCDALREHIRRFPEGAYRERAAAMLSTRSVTRVEQWTLVQRPLRIVVGRDAPASATEATARSAAIERGRKKAQTLCQDFGASGLARFREAGVEAQEWTCEAVRGGSVCGFEGRALCALDELSTVERETCNANSPR